MCAHTCCATTCARLTLPCSSGVQLSPMLHFQATMMPLSSPATTRAAAAPAKPPDRPNHSSVTALAADPSTITGCGRGGGHGRQQHNTQRGGCPGLGAAMCGDCYRGSILGLRLLTFRPAACTTLHQQPVRTLRPNLLLNTPQA